MPEQRDEIAKLEALYANNPEGRVFTHLAEAYRKAGELDRARGILEQGLAKHAGYASAHVVLGRVLMDQQSNEEASEAFRRVLELDPHNMVALRSLGDIARAGGRTGEALKYFEELRHQEPTNEEIGQILTELRAAPPESESQGQGQGEVVTEEATAQAEREAEAAAATSDSAASAAAAEGLPTPGEMISSEKSESFESGEAPPPHYEAAPDAEKIEAPPGSGMNLDWLPDDEEEESVLPGDLPQLAGFSDITQTADSTLGGEVVAVGDEEVEEVPELDTTFQVEEEPVADAAESFEDFTLNVPEPEPEEEEELEMLEPLPELEPFNTPGSEEVSEQISEGAGAGASAGVGASEDIVAERTMPAFEPAAEPEAEPEPEPEPAAAPVAESVTTPVSESGEVMTETIAELYRSQGLNEKAAEVYRGLLQQRPDDAELQSKLAEVEAAQLEPIELTEAEPAAEPEPHVEAAPWIAPTSHVPQAPTPYAWSEQQAEPEREEGAPIATYFQSLLSWRPTNYQPEAVPVPVQEPEPTAPAQHEHAHEHEHAATAEDDDLMTLLDNPVVEDTPVVSIAQEMRTEAAAADPWADEPVAPPPVQTSAPVAQPMVSEPYEPVPAMPSPAPVTPEPPRADDFMPWEEPQSAPEAPAAAAAPMQPQATEPPPTTSATNAADAFDDLFPADPAAEAPAASREKAAPAEGEGGGDDDDDVEMFKSWLQSLKK